MVGDVIESIRAIKSTTEKLSKTNQTIVEKYQKKVRQVLSGKKAILTKFKSLHISFSEYYTVSATYNNIRESLFIFS